MREKKDYKVKVFSENDLIENAGVFVELCVASFAEHRKNNVLMGPCFMTAEKWKSWVKDCFSLCLWNENELIAFWLVRLDHEKKIADGRIMAVSPDYKGQHIGRDLSQILIPMLREKGMNIFKTDTSLKAPHVIKFHKSYGCKAVGVASWSNTNYYTVLLRLALNPKCEISDFRALLMYFFSLINCRLKFQENGKFTPFFSIVKKLIG